MSKWIGLNQASLTLRIQKHDLLDTGARSPNSQQLALVQRRIHLLACILRYTIDPSHNECRRRSLWNRRVDTCEVQGRNELINDSGSIDELLTSDSRRSTSRSTAFSSLFPAPFPPRTIHPFQSPKFPASHRHSYPMTVTSSPGKSRRTVWRSVLRPHSPPGGR